MKELSALLRRVVPFIYPDGRPGGMVTISYQQATAGFWITAATMYIYTSDEASSG
jgi:hypothetical protein